MIEINQTIKFILKHPTKGHHLEMVFIKESYLDDWLPYLNAFEDYLIQEAIKQRKNVSVV